MAHFELAVLPLH